MAIDVAEAVPRLLAEAGWGERRVTSSRSLAGGCISAAAILTLDDGREVFVKENTAEMLDAFECEAEGLAALREAAALRVPEVIAVAAVSAPGRGNPSAAEGRSRAIFVSEAIAEGRRRADFFELFGAALATLHRVTCGGRFGWHRDGYLGSARQPGGWSDDWVEFFATERLEYQLRWAQEQHVGNERLDRAVRAVIDRLPELLQSDDVHESVLLHGDLWSGNYLADESGRPVVIDPAVYRGHREAELGMLRLFGGCPPAFYTAYEAAWPLQPGWQQRVEVYVLYHLLNHLNLFGGSYLGQSLQTAEAIVGGRE